MDTKMKLQKSLPPLVEGKIHGYLKLVVDEVLWSKRNFGEIRVFVSWWGETDRSEFRPADITKNVTRPIQETTEIYAIRTNINLFEEYIKNCESVELVIVSEETNIIIGTSQITDILEIFKCKPYFGYVPIVTNSGNKVGEIHISMKLEHTAKSCNMQLKTHRYEKKQAVDDTLLSTINDFKNQQDTRPDRYTISRKVNPEEAEAYKSILKLRRTEFQEPVNKFSNKVADKLVAQVVARAQRLRGAILKETYDEDELNFSDNTLGTHISAEEELKLHDYFLGDNALPSDEKKTLYTLSLTDLASNSFKPLRYGNKSTTNNVPSTRMNVLVEDALLEKRSCIDSKEAELCNFVNYIRINIESFTLSPAGYRRVKSSSLSNNDNTFLSATYFVQYDMTFDYSRETDKKWVKEGRPVRICSKKQTNQVIYFNHISTYRVSKVKQDTERLVKFKIFVRHVNKKSLTELATAAICINDIIKSENWRFAQQLFIVNKGIKIGELSVIIELGSDSSHFEEQLMDSIMSTKENIPMLETQQLLNETRNKRSKSVTKNQSKTGNEVTSVSVVNSLTTDSDLVTAKSTPQFTTESIDGKKIDTKNHENRIEDKVLLHGLIYIAEGQELPELNTYLICRAFWREDKTRSQICNNTRNPSYQFFQLVPLIYDSDLLERIKDNYIIIEVYSRKNNIDSLLGLTKLSVHQLYVAYRDPRVLPHLLLCKYPVVSVDGWVPIVNPVTGQSCGQLLALVALGTAEQIALLEMSRGLRTIVGTMPQAIHLERFPDYAKRTQNTQQPQSAHRSQLNRKTFSQNNSRISAADSIERDMYFANSRSRECQTDISTVKEFKFSEEAQGRASSSKYSVPHEHDTAEHFAQVVDVNKINIDQAAQTEISLEEKKQASTEEQTCMNDLNFISSDDSDNNSIRHNFHLPTETYRSVGVGAEYNEEIDQQPNSDQSNTTFELPTMMYAENESTNSTYSQSVFRAIVEIECALHLPKVEQINETIEPSTYVSFQANKSDHAKHANSYTITDVFPHSCNPKWNWKCDAELPIELLLHDEKRLILKIWRILDPDDGMQINLERDVVIGFSAIDLSVLISGFPTVSGWFHIMDFTGKCNGQIKVCITPLDNLSLYGKPLTTTNTTRLPSCSMSQLNWVPANPYEMHCSDAERNNTNNTSSTVTQEEEKSVHSENQSSDSVIHIGMEDVSMSFLSLSLKQKLTELDEITKRLESRLRDVTNTAFEDDLENEFDSNEPNSDHENNDYKVTAPMASITTMDHNSRSYQIPQADKKKILHPIESKENESQNTSNETHIQNCLPRAYVNRNKTVACETTKPNPSCLEISNSYTKQNLSNDDCQMQHPSEHLTQSIRMLDSAFADYPERGTKTHINYLLDKLSLQFPADPYLTKTVPTKKNVISLLTNLQSSNNNFQDSSRCNQELKVCTVPTQTNNIHEQIVKNSKNLTTSCAINTEHDVYDRISPETSMQSEIANKISTVIREELVAEENSNTSKCDELTTYLVTSNIRHMDLNNMFNPLFYPHLMPDLHYSNTSPEEETIKQLDNRYSKVFSTSMSNRLNKANCSVETNTPLENAELFRTTPSGVSENIDDSIDLTVLHKASYNNLLASNSTDSTTTISMEKSLIKSIDSEAVENGDSTISETSVLEFSRQAPDGGNPIEDTRKPLITPQDDDIQQSSSSSCN